MKYNLDYLAESYGYDDVMDMLQDYVTDSVVPAVCTQCGWTGEMEPDQQHGWCENCQDRTVISCLILAGII